MRTTREAVPVAARWLSIPIACVLLSACGLSSEPDPTPQLRAMAASEWSAYRTAHAVPEGGLALLVMTPRGTWSASTDMGDVDVPRVHYRIGSNTKSFTAASIMLLYQEGKLDIDDTITATIPGRTIPYVPDTPAYAIPYKSAITIRRLLNHTAGVYDHSNYPVYDSCTQVPYHGGFYVDYVLKQPGQAEHTFTFEELVAVNATCQQSHFPPGTSVQYSNLGYDILGTIVERVSGLSYSEFVMRRLVEPNALRETTVPYLGNDQELPTPNVLGYFRYNGVFRAMPRYNVSSTVSEGNIVSTPTDVAHWVRNLVNGNAGVSKRYVEMMQVCRVPAQGLCYGFGIFHAPPLGWGHNGGIPGFVSYMMYNPDDDVAVVVFSNMIDGDNMADEMHFLVCVANQARQILGYDGQCPASPSPPVAR